MFVCLFLRGHPSCLLPVRGVGEAGAGRASGWVAVRPDIGKKAEAGRSLLPEFAFPLVPQSLCKLGCSIYIKHELFKYVLAFRQKF